MYNNLPALTDSILWDEKLLSTDYEALSEGALAAALQSYLRGLRADGTKTYVKSAIICL